MYEELQLDSEELDPISEDIFKVKTRILVEQNFPYLLRQLLTLVEEDHEIESINLLFSMIKPYDSLAAENQKLEREESPQFPEVLCNLQPALALQSLS